ncbi:Cdc25 phosphatase Ibp1 [Neurospora sp. IMI 360204]|nr:Cdc25 phosphatase Ibp1 [Neurospora sp. IMI 360204]
MTTIGSLQRLSATSLSKLILAEQASAATAAAGTAGGSPTLAIIDVRDDDYIGGHIKGSQNVPSRKLDAMLPTLVRQLQDKETVVFHCALSQQRGPSAALRYIRERERLMPKEVETKLTSAADSAAVEEVVGADGEGKEKEEEGEKKKPVNQKVFVLDRGFVGWQEAFGLDERLTEGYSKELWRDGYWM